MWRKDASFSDVLYIAKNMQEEFRREIYATRWDDDPASVALQAMDGGSFCWVCGLERPIAALGAVPVWPNVWQVWMFATDELPRIRFSLTRFARRVMIPALIKSGAHSAHCYVNEEFSSAHGWLTKCLGGKKSEPLKNFGRNKETFFIFSWSEEQ